MLPRQFDVRRCGWLQSWRNLTQTGLQGLVVIGQPQPGFASGVVGQSNFEIGKEVVEGLAVLEREGLVAVEAPWHAFGFQASFHQEVPAAVLGPVLQDDQRKPDV
jgi:hypothetical protein